MSTSDSTFQTVLSHDSLYGGNLSQAAYTYRLGPQNTVRKRYFYGYDGMDRLTDALTETGAIAGAYAYAYDTQSRLSSKQEEGLDDLPAYVYTPGENQLLCIPGHERIRILKTAYGANAM